MSESGRLFVGVTENQVQKGFEVVNQNLTVILLNESTMKRNRVVDLAGS